MSDSSWRSSLHLRGDLRSCAGRLAHLGGRGTDRVHDVVIARAAAQVAFDRMTDLSVARRCVPLEEVDGGDHETGSAEATLQPMLLRERALDRVQLTVLREALDRDDHRAIRLDREHRA